MAKRSYTHVKVTWIASNSVRYYTIDDYTLLSDEALEGTHVAWVSRKEAIAGLAEAAAAEAQP